MNDADMARVHDVTTFISTIILILAILMILSRSRTPEMKLLLIGIFMAIAASVQSGVSGVSVGPQQVALLAGLGSSSLMKIAVLLTLSGVGMMFMSRLTPPPAASTSTPIVKEHPHVD
jgi:hypothetical protein